MFRVPPHRPKRGLARLKTFPTLWLGRVRWLALRALALALLA
jgi:hypothetical protein